MEGEENTCRQVDVIIAAWNRADTIERAVVSALAEPETLRVFVIDDASTDSTAKRARQADDGSGRLVIERQPRNLGPSAARNRALALASGPWVTILDGDDFMMKGRLGKLLALAGDWDFVADDLLQIEEGRLGRDTPRPLLSDKPFEPWRLDFPTFVLGNVSRAGRDRKELGFFKPLIRRSFLEARGLRYSENLRLGEDYALYARALALGARFRVVPAQGYVSVTRSNSLSATHSKQDLERLRDSDIELEAIPTLTEHDRTCIGKHYRSIDARVQWLEVIEAVKAREFRRFLAPFFRSLDVSWFLAAHLAEQVRLRGLKRLGLRG